MFNAIAVLDIGIADLPTLVRTPKPCMSVATVPQISGELFTYRGSDRLSHPGPAYRKWAVWKKPFPRRQTMTLPALMMRSCTVKEIVWTSAGHAYSPEQTRVPHLSPIQPPIFLHATLMHRVGLTWICHLSIRARVTDDQLPYCFGISLSENDLQKAARNVVRTHDMNDCLMFRRGTYGA